MADQPTAEIERFRPTNGRIVGVIGLALCRWSRSCRRHRVTPVAVPGVIGCAFVAVLVWVAMLRPSVVGRRTGAAPADAVLDDHHPAGLHRHRAGAPLPAGPLGRRKYICPAISRSAAQDHARRDEVERRRRPAAGASLKAGASATGENLQTEVKSEHGARLRRLRGTTARRLAADDRARRGIEERSEEEYELGSQVVRRTAWPESASWPGSRSAFVVALVVV